MPPPEKRNGDSKLEKITIFTTRSASSLRPRSTDGRVYFGCRDSNLYALDAATGQKQWAFNNKGSWVISSPAVQDGKVYFATSDSAMLFAMDAKAGTPIFLPELQTLADVLFSRDRGAACFISGRIKEELIAIDLASQNPHGLSRPTHPGRMALPSPNQTEVQTIEVAFTDNFYDSMVIGVSKMMTAGAVLSSPVVVNNVIYVGSTDGFLYALM